MLVTSPLETARRVGDTQTQDVEASLCQPVLFQPSRSLLAVYNSLLCHRAAYLNAPDGSTHVWEGRTLQLSWRMLFSFLNKIAVLVKKCDDTNVHAFVKVFNMRCNAAFRQ